MEDITKRELILIDAADDMPRIILDEKNYLIDIKGSSYPEDAFEVYHIVLKWLNSVPIIQDKELICRFNFNILSSASHKMVFEILIRLESLKIDGDINVKIIWEYDEIDEDMEEAGHDFNDTIELPFEFVSS